MELQSHQSQNDDGDQGGAADAMAIDENDANDHCNYLAADEEDVVVDDDCDYYAYESGHDLQNDDYFGDQVVAARGGDDAVLNC